MMWSPTNINPNTMTAAALNFNVYDILEPKKVAIQGSDSTTAMLIDLSDNTDKSGNNLDVPQDLHGSFIDKKKAEYDLLDVFQNIYVTPQQIKGKEKDLAINNTVTETPQIDFTEFFEQLESGHRIDWTKCNSNDKNDFNSNKILIKSKSQKQLVEIHNINVNKTPTHSRSFDEVIDSAILSKFPEPDFKLEHLDQVSENDIYDFLQPKPLPPLLDVNKSMQKSNDETFSDPNNIPSTAAINAHSQSIQLTNLIDKNINRHQPLNHTFATSCASSLNCNNSLNSTILSKATKEMQTISIQMFSDASKQPTVVTSSVKDKNILTTLQNCNNCKPQLTLGSLSRNLFELPRKNYVNTTIYKTEINSPLIDLNSPPIFSLCRKYVTQTLQTVKKDNKLYLKRRIVKNNFEKNGFTKGPDIYEKSVVLPQIMSRLAARQKALNEQNNLRPKLKLDTSSKCNTIPSADLCDKNAIKPISETGNAQAMLELEVLMADCNSERLKALQRRKAFETFVKTGKCIQ